MATRPPAQPKRRAPLTRDRVLRAAIGLADQTGLETLTMRRLGQELGVEAMSLYNHVPGKEALLDGMVDLVFSEIEPPTTDVDWRTAMRRRAVSTRDALLRHPWAIGLMEARSKPGPSNLALHEAALKCLREAGFSLALTASAYSVQDSYIYGYALQEKALPDLGAPDVGAQVAERMLPQAPLREYPYSVEMVGGFIAAGGYDMTEQFEFGLDLILESLERLRGTA